MLLCPKAWDTANYKASIKSQQGTAGDAYYHEYRSLPGVFLHEMMHLIDFVPHSMPPSPVLDLNGGAR